MRKADVLNILVVDDEEEICKIFEKWLSLEGHRLESALTGKRAINLVKKKNFDIVFLDIVMPGILAVDVLEKIKKISSRTKVVIITGKSIYKDLMNEWQQRGASGFLQKPFKIEDVKKCLVSLGI